MPLGHLVVMSSSSALDITVARLSLYARAFPHLLRYHAHPRQSHRECEVLESGSSITFQGFRDAVVRASRASPTNTTDTIMAKRMQVASPTWQESSLVGRHHDHHLGPALVSSSRQSVCEAGYARQLTVVIAYLGSVTPAVGHRAHDRSLQGSLQRSVARVFAAAEPYKPAPSRPPPSQGTSVSTLACHPDSRPSARLSSHRARQMVALSAHRPKKKTPVLIPRFTTPQKVIVIYDVESQVRDPDAAKQIAM